jgi:5-(carboxyamino)imidazole ribonucleotide synthase
MLALAGARLGQRMLFLDPAPDACAGAVGEQIVAPYDDPDALDALAARCDVVTYEFENVPVGAARTIAERVPVWPPPAALEVAQDRLAEKRLFERCGLRVPAYRAASGPEELEAAVAAVGIPCVVKTRRLGYDGKGQVVVRTPADLDAAAALAGVPLIVEELVAFRRELSVLGVRGHAGDSRFYPLVENHHRAGILRTSIAPAPDLDPGLGAGAERNASAIMDALGYRGVIAIELFEADGEVLANEMAPRVHNSGHWTIDGAPVSQFENHLRAILGLPLGSTEATGPAAMVNLIGELPPLETLAALPEARIHLYGKQPRPGRKLGHVNLLAPDHRMLAEQLDALQRLLANS